MPPAQSSPQSRPSQPAKKLLFEISLAQWSLHRAIKGGKLDPLDFPIVARRDYAIHAVEYVNQFFKDKANDRAWLDDLKRRADGEGVQSLLIMIDGEGALGDAEKARRAKAVEHHCKWLDTAKHLGCHSIRVNADSTGTPDEQRDRVVDGLAKLVERAAAQEINVLVENHGGLSSNGAWLASVMRQVNHPHCGTLPDFGNFTIARRADGSTETYDRYRGVEELMPFAKSVSAKSHDFDDTGEETTIDYRRMMKIVIDAGYQGHVGIEYEGERMSEPEGIRATKALLQRVREEFSREGE